MKIRAFVFSIIVSIALIATCVSFPVKAAVQQSAISALMPYLNECRQTYTNFRHGDRNAVAKMQSRHNEQDNMILSLVCIGYAYGYEDGRRGEA